MHSHAYSEYYTNRRNERALIQDFPGDEVLIEGLHAMQVHLRRNGRDIDIPVVRVMNAAHFLVSYMFAITCSGDQTELDVLAYATTGHDKRLMYLTMVVLAAMLRRTDGFRARQCRNVLLEDRSEDFNEGVSLYEQFLASAEKRFAEEDFLQDIPCLIREIQGKESIIAQQNQTIQRLQNTITTMENQQNIFMAPVYQGCTFNTTTNTTNNYYPAPQTDHTANTACSEKEQAEPAKNDRTTAADYQNILPVPRKGKYTEVRKYILERCKFDEEFRQFVENHSRVELCMRLTDEFGWDVDEHALGVNMNRNR